MRFCADFRRLNLATVADTYPLPRMDDSIDSLGDARVFTTLDALWGYWQVPVAKEDRDKTTFVSHMGSFRYKRMPFGLRNAPATFQRTLDVILSGVKWKTCLVYIDDVIIFSKNEEEHVDHLEQVLSLLGEAGVKLKLKKCFFFKQEVEYLGHIIRPGTLSVGYSSDATRTIEERTFPEDLTQLRSFLGACNVYRRFVKNFAKVATPLSAMLRAGAQNDWKNPTESQIEAFEALKKVLVSPPVLALPKVNRPYIDRLRREQVRHRRRLVTTTRPRQAEGMGNHRVLLQDID